MVAAAAVVVLAACSAGGDGGGADALVRSSDARLARAAEALLPDLARRAGLELTRPVRLERRSRAELERYLDAKLDEQLPHERARNVGTVYELLGMVPRGTDLRALLRSIYLEQVGGFYDPDSTTLFVMDDQSPDVLEPLLVHELVHALQDQATDLDSITDPARGNDAATAATAAVEGHATLVMFEAMLSRQQGEDVDLTRLPDLMGTIGPSLAEAREASPALASAPRVVQESLLFPYLGGAAFLADVWAHEPGRRPPFGARLPASTEQVLHPERYRAESRDAPTRLVLEADPAPALEDGLGELETGIFLEGLYGDEAARALARGWDGDRFALFRPADGAPALVWVSVWDAPGSRDRFVEAVRARAAALPVPSVLEPIEVDGRPGVRLSVGEAPAVRVHAEGGVP
ncbi:MAG: hypothetical protein D6701_04980 [Gemmatimonadetes bacterium]|nr:MAG: hypothetical protein D6701_04980 [Gemmatimonadota bacterium]